MTMKVGKLKSLLSKILDTLKDCEEDQELELQGNTYFRRGNSYVLETPNGFLGLDNIEEALKGDDDEGDDE